MSNDLQKRIEEMNSFFLANANSEILPSKYWIELNKRNIAQLEKDGYQNFKRTIVRNYFTWFLAGDNIPFRYLFKGIFKDSQVCYLIKNLSKITVLRALFFAIFKTRKQCLLTFTQSIACNFLTYLVWKYAKSIDTSSELNKLDEPLEGNPPRIYLNGKLISQDIVNSFLEYKSITDAIPKEKIKNIMELGAGYGRTAFVFLKLLPNIKYIIVDIPPALAIAEKYLSNQFPSKKIFRFRPFFSYSEIESEFNNANIVFLLPNQIHLLPPKIVDLFINISSLHEMKLSQIDYYFNLIDNLTNGFLYLKQWKISRIPYENIVITEKDYPIKNNWKQIYWRECAVHTRFFEALFKQLLPSVRE